MKASIQVDRDFRSLSKEITEKTRTRIMRVAVSKGASIVKKEVVELAPRRYGYLKRSIKIHFAVYGPHRDIQVAIIGPKRKAVWQKGVIKRGPKKGQPRRHRPAFIAHIIEYGSKHARAKPFLRPALDATRAAYEAAVSQRLKEELDKILKKG